MRSLFDIGLLLALFDPLHVQHDIAAEWWAANKAHGWATSPITQNGFIRIVTQVTYPNAVSPEIAMTILAAQIVESDHAFWPDDISLVEMERFDRDRILGPKQLTDIYLVGLAVRYGGRLATLDRSISIAAVRHATAANVIVVS